MIDWLLVGRNALWIAGLALVLTAWSYYHWLATTTGAPRAVVFRSGAWILSSSIGLTLFAIGQALSPARWYEHLGWAAIGVYAVIDGAQRWRSRE